MVYRVTDRDQLVDWDWKELKYGEREDCGRQAVTLTEET
jgi:hypothetical protein